jgi:hypothetical protein
MKKVRSKPKRQSQVRPKQRRMPKFPPVGEEMKRWSALLGEELQKWPAVTSKPMFGMTGFHRGKKIFAALPATRSLFTPTSIIFRIKPMPPELLEKVQQEPRFNLEGRNPGAMWWVFEISSELDLTDALWWIGQAYERAK